MTDSRASWWGMWIIVVLVASMLLGPFWLGDRHVFGKFVMRPVPASVRTVEVDSNDWPFRLNPEPVVYIRFQASAEDVARIVAHRQWAESRVDRSWLEGRGPAWWRPPLREEGTRCFKGQGRRGQEYLLIDGTGTNAWFLLWGI